MQQGVCPQSNSAKILGIFEEAFDSDTTAVVRFLLKMQITLPIKKV